MVVVVVLKNSLESQFGEEPFVFATFESGLELSSDFF